MIRRVVTILAVVFGVLLITIITQIVVVLFDAESYVIDKLYEDTGLVVPADHIIERSSGSYIFGDSVYVHFKFNDKEFQELISNLKSTPYFNDTVALREIIDAKWDPDDPRKIWRLKGMWVNWDSIYYYLSLNSSNSEIGQTWIEKDAKLLKVKLDF